MVKIYLRWICFFGLLLSIALAVACAGEKKQEQKETTETKPTEVIRNPAHAGQFYPANPDELKAQVSGFLDNAKTQPENGVMAITVPHAGYVFSGKVAGEGFRAASTCQPDTIVLLGPYHYGPLSGAAVFTSGKFLSPLGSSQIDEDLAKLFLEKVKDAKDNPTPHYQEHSLENQLPFIHYIWGNVPILPILVGNGNKDFAKELGEGLLALIKESGKNLLIVSTVDLSHYYPVDVAKTLDDAALSALKDSDPLRIVDTNEQGTSAVDAPVVFGAVNYAMRELGISQPEILCYATSADYNKDTSKVVGYSAVVWRKE
jgi:AmmeMemoRadiSam system protein B